MDRFLFYKQLPDSLVVISPTLLMCLFWDCWSRSAYLPSGTSSTCGEIPVSLILDAGPPCMSFETLVSLILDRHAAYLLAIRDTGPPAFCHPNCQSSVLPFKTPVLLILDACPLLLFETLFSLILDACPPFAI